MRSLKFGLRNLARTKLRSSLTMLGVIFGVCSVIVMLAVGEGTKRTAIRQIEALGTRNVIVRSAKPVRDTSETGEGVVRPYGLTRDDPPRLVEAIHTIRFAAPVRTHRRELRYGERALEGRVVAVTPEYQELSGITVRRGRFITDLDRRRLNGVAVLGTGTAAALFPLEDPIGRSVRIGGDRYFRIVGVAAAQASSPGYGDVVPAQDFSRDVYVPLETDRARFGRFLAYVKGGSLQREGLEVSQITVAVDEARHVKETARIIAGVLDRYHEEADTNLIVPMALLEKVEETQRLFNMVLGAIASISLLVGGIGIMNIMLATVSERTGEIGILRALGAKRRDIVSQFLVETVVLSASGGGIGVVVGFLVSHAIAGVLHINTVIQPWAVLLASAISVAVGLVFGLYPARRAALMDPIEALRRD